MNSSLPELVLRAAARAGFVSATLQLAVLYSPQAFHHGIADIEANGRVEWVAKSRPSFVAQLGGIPDWHASSLEGSRMKSAQLMEKHVAKEKLLRST
ncbi:hypothetical protein CVT26_005374 [Gymnopilus dilepis]|uniref:Uncharacterized protein n=1 Tax=Gymnopilus dilepis TaxID=231916 RepID=A0A409YT26_9AGAR|nr:hypothetical protein CVT26_005374 [Gymnopilus dilepis]